ncbi:hypothetical protein [Streptomyces viridochromogenes]|uniref:hypothetical protein n=1 Tax=Streptomyces viridochromogenes TaxID=1938 RepID=UPI000AB4DCC2|nr:hypothetical protein [Streptomyces viridochromogenes]
MRPSHDPLRIDTVHLVDATADQLSKEDHLEHLATGPRVLHEPVPSSWFTPSRKRD